MNYRTDLTLLTKMLINFRDARDWKQFHDPKNLAMALAIESAELQEIFLWKSKDEVLELIRTEDGFDKVKEELADILIYLLYLSEACKVDLSEAVKEKIKINEQRYPLKINI